jgi:hypothetical protein
MSRGQRGMTAQIHFHQRREPPQPEPIILSSQEGRFGQVVFGRDLLQDFIRRPGLQQTDSGWIAPKGLGCKGIHLIVRKAHDLKWQRTLAKLNHVCQAWQLLVLLP